MLEITLIIATLVSGVAAFFYFSDRWRDRGIDPKRLHQKLQAAGYGEAVLEASNELKRLALEKPRLWEFRFLEEALSEQISSHRGALIDLEHGRRPSSPRHLSWDEAKAWCQSHVESLRDLINRFESLVQAAVKALGPPGVPASLSELLHVSAAFGRVYGDAICWSQDFRSVLPPKAWRGVFGAMAGSSLSITEGVEEFRDKYAVAIRRAEKELEEGAESFDIDVTVTPRSPVSEDLEEQIAALARSSR